MKSVVILRGVPGSGKSTGAKSAVEAFYKEHGRDTAAKVFSADQFFTNAVTGEYLYDASKIGQAHGDCLRRFAHFVEDEWAEQVRRDRDFAEPAQRNVLAIVDNTNCTNVEVAPYYELGRAYRFEVECWVCIHRDLHTAFERNTHGVSLERIWKMSADLTDAVRTAPAWWTYRVHWVK